MTTTLQSEANRIFGKEEVKKTAFFSRKLTFKETCFIFRHGWKACNVRLFMMFSQIFLEHPFKVQNFVIATRLKSAKKGFIKFVVQ